jgi:transcription-repair coupling factor (superfamily II helicase)
VVISDKQRGFLKEAEIYIPPGLEGTVCKDLLSEFDNVLYIVEDIAAVSNVVQASKFFMDSSHEVLEFPALAYEGYRYSYPSNLLKRAYALSRLMASPNKKLIVTDTKALFQYQTPKDLIAKQNIVLTSLQEIKFTGLVRSLANFGYQRVSVAEAPGEFAVRGGIIDIVLLNMAVRLSFVGDSITQMKLYDVDSQISGQSIVSVLIHAVNELITDADIANFKSRFDEKYPSSELTEVDSWEGLQQVMPLHHFKHVLYQQDCSIFDYLAEKTVLLHGNSIHTQMSKVWQDFETQYNTAKDFANLHDLPFNYLLPKEEYLSPQEIKQSLGQYEKKICLEFANQKQIFAPIGRSIYQASQLQQVSIYTVLKDFLRDMQRLNKIVVIALSNMVQLKKLSEFFAQQQVKCQEIENIHELKKAKVALTILPIKASFQSDDYVFLVGSDIFGKQAMAATPSKKFNMQKFMQESNALKHGELIVHKDFGIGSYAGIEEMDIVGNKRDYVKLVYFNNEKYYLPVEYFDLISKYGGSEEAELDRLGRLSWAARKKKTQEKIKVIAEKLMQIAAKRRLAKGITINSNGAIYTQFCQKFPHVETEDQLNAIDAVQNDLASGRVMDRLICGDVGFGKTEVALRAACMAVAGDNPVQVAIIAPTTLLVSQHLKLVQDRFTGFDVKIAAISRLQTPKESRAVKAKLKNGEIDIVIATHALLAKDVNILNLGLLIIDEEQHFGVKQKEKFKNMRPNVHILTMSATPIPRTLQMSLVGIKELSLLATAPVDRVPIKSEIVPFANNIMKEAIAKELARQGIVFVVTPRIKNIDKLYKLITKIVPTARVKAIHGKLSADEVSEVINQLHLQQLDILISTQIIESGVDIENANTLIVHEADMFGLSQLYQIRGRVGRRKKQAFAYLTYAKDKILSDNAKERLQVLQSLDSLGSSFNLAAADMDSRGYGNLVGEEQSGNIKDIGVELYQKMLQDAIYAQEHQQEQKSLQPLLLDDVTIQIKLPIQGHIPKSLVADENLRCNLYRRIMAVGDIQQIEDIKTEIQDRFGAVPEQVQNLCHIVIIKSLAKTANISKIETKGRNIKLSFYQRKIFDPGALIDYLQEILPKYQVSFQG